MKEPYKTIVFVIVVAFLIYGIGKAGQWDYEQLEAANQEAHRYETIGK